MFVMAWLFSNYLAYVKKRTKLEATLVNFENSINVKSFKRFLYVKSEKYNKV